MTQPEEHFDISSALLYFPSLTFTETGIKFGALTFQLLRFECSFLFVLRLLQQCGW